MRNPSSAAALPPSGKDCRGAEPHPDAADPAMDFPEIRGFEILGWAGCGGMGEVWRALQLAEQRIVAIKILRAPAGAPARQGLIAERFKREIAVAAQFDHPALTRVLGSGVTTAGQAYVVMEWVEGLPLDEYVTKLPQSLPQRIALGVAIARGVQQLHERGCIHRDLKPGNILVTETGQPRILDFGLARPLDALEYGPTVSLEGDLIGTPHFMSPEQAAGDSGRVGTRSDVWSLGLLLFYLVSGHWPWPAALPAADVLQKILTTDPPRLRTRARDTPRDLEAIVMRCLSRDPAQRYDGAGAVAEDLDRWQRGEPVTARPATVPYLLGNALRRHRRLTMAAAGVLAAALAAVFWHQHVQSETNRRLQLALDEATSLRSYLLFDLRWNLDSTGREDILDAAARRAEDFPATLAAADLPPGPKFDPRRFESLAANLRGQSLAFRGNLSGALESCFKEHTLNLALVAAYPDDPQSTMNLISSGIGASGLLLRLERAAEVRPVLEPVFKKIREAGTATAVSPGTWQGDLLQLLILLSRSDREIALAARSVTSRIKRSDAVIGPSGGKSGGSAPSYPAPLEEAISLLPAYESGADASILLVCAVHTEAAEWALAEGDGASAGRILWDVFRRLDEGWAAKPRDPALLAATVLCQRNLTRAAILTGDLDAAWKELGNAGYNLEALRKDGYFEPSMWKERAVARTAQDLADALLAKNRGETANHVLHLSARMLEVRQHRPVAVQLPAADSARQNWLTGRVRRISGDLAGAELSSRRAMESMEKCVTAEPDNPLWLLDLAETGLQLRSILTKMQRPSSAAAARVAGERTAAALAAAASHPRLTSGMRQRLAGLSARLKE